MQGLNTPLYFILLHVFLEENQTRMNTVLEHVLQLFDRFGVSYSHFDFPIGLSYS